MAFRGLSVGSLRYVSRICSYHWLARVGPVSLAGKWIIGWKGRTLIETLYKSFAGFKNSSGQEDYAPQRNTDSKTRRLDEETNFLCLRG